MALLAAAPGPDRTLDLHASADHSKPAFKKFLYSWPLPETVHFTGLSGPIVTRAARASFNEALVSVRWMPSGTCPKNGEVYDTYQEIKDRYPGSRQLMANIIKSPAQGSTAAPVDFSLPGSVPVSHCLYVILDGATLVGGNYAMTSKLALHYMNEPSAVQLTTDYFGDEFCFGMTSGCGPRHTISGSHAFMTFFRFEPQRNVVLVAAQGNASASPMTPDVMALSSVAFGPWSVTNDLYVLQDCRGRPRRTAETDDASNDRLLDGAVRISRLVLQGDGMQSAQRQLQWRADRSAVMIPPDGCLVHLAKKTGTGAINAEYQVTLFSKHE